MNRFQIELHHQFEELVLLGIRVAKDAALFAIIWMFLYATHRLTLRYPIEGGAAAVLATLHGVFAVATFAIVAIIAMWDMITTIGVRHR